MMLSFLLLFFPCFFGASLAKSNNIPTSRSIPSLFADGSSFPLLNSAEPGLSMPALGLGTGYYSIGNQAYDVYPECGAEPHNGPLDPPGPTPPGCGPNTQKAVYTWLAKAGGRRIDNANSYYNQRSVALGIEQSLVDRSQIFILSKVGPSYPLGYNETIEQIRDILQQLRTSWVDMLLIHAPSMTQSYSKNSSDPACNMTSTRTYNEKDCRLSTWSAMVLVYKLGLARSIGVSNYNITHLQEIIDAGLPLPSANQVPFHPYNYRTGQADLLAFCQKNNIQLISYSPLGALDVHKFPVKNGSEVTTGMSPTLLEDPVIISLAKAYKRTPAQILLRWIYQLGVPSNPRSMNETHMIENLDILSNPFTISNDDMTRIVNLAQDTCDVDPHWGACVRNRHLA